MSRAETFRRIAAELGQGDTTVADIAAALDMSDSYIADMLYAMGDAVHCHAGTAKRGVYRLGPSPAGHTINRVELNRRAVLDAIKHEARTCVEICEIVGISRSYVRGMLRDLAEQIVVVDSDTTQRNGVMPKRYIAVDATPAPPRPERVALPGWAAALSY